MVKENPFAILVACEANEQVKEVLEHGNPIPDDYPALAAQKRVFNWGPPRPDFQYTSQQGRSAASSQGPDRNYH